MRARELLQAGDLSAAIDAATNVVRTAPSDLTARIFLFELLAAAGQYERAQKHLAVAIDQAPAMQEGILSYRGVLAAEQARSVLFQSGDGGPQQVTPIPLNPEPQLTAIRELRHRNSAEARLLIEKAESERASRPGTVDDVPFEDFRDAHDLLAPFLEVLCQGHYGWIPFTQISILTFEPPKFFRDLLWRPTTIRLVDGSSSRMLVPVRYPGSERDSDNSLKLGRSTAWRDEDGVVEGIGQRAFFVGDDLHYLLSVREVRFLD